MVSTQINRQQNKRLLSQLGESDIDFMIGQNSHETQRGNRAKTVDQNATLINANNSVQVNSAQMDMHTLRNKIFNKVRIEVNNVMTSVETNLQDALLCNKEFGDSLSVTRNEVC